VGEGPDRGDYFSKAAELLPGGASGWLRREFHSQGPLILSRGEGPWVYTVWGEKLLDLNMAFGAVVLGHSDPDVAGAVAEQAGRLVLHGAGASDVEIEFARLLSSLFPNVDKLLFTASGSEAVLAALRVSRAVTGRSVIVKFEGNYHGWHDYVAYNIKTPLGSEPSPESAGIPGHVGATVRVLPYNDVERLRSFMEEHGDTVAAVILEPVAHSMGVVPADRAFVAEARRLCRTYGCLLVFDEIITGVRCGLRGLQEYYGVDADLVTLGKGIANGLPVAALGGKREVMEAFESNVVTSGTYAAHPLSMAGGIVALTKAVRIRADRAMEDAARRMSRIVGEVLEESGLEAAVSQFGGSLSIHFGLEEPPRNLRQALRADHRLYARLARALRKTGVLVNPNPLKRLSVSASHGEEAIEHFAVNLRRAVKSLKREGKPGA
jgi:glutamate-1-semialdehyde 2,1-aminomutase